MLQPRVSPQGPAQPGLQLIKDLYQDIGITVKPGSGSAGQEAKSWLWDSPPLPLWHTRSVLAAKGQEG